MALPAAPASISLGQIQTEFGGSNPISLSEYYKGGSYVTTSDTAPNVPSSGQISLGNFRGAIKYTGATSVEALVVAGGGGGGDSGTYSGTYNLAWAGGGGAGGLRTSPSISVTGGTTYTVTVGGGGAGIGGTAPGGASSFRNLSCSGGGQGSSASFTQINGYSGGSGSGASYGLNGGEFSGSGGAGTAGEGNNGGNSTQFNAAGGGGAGGAGSYGGTRGSGASHSITGASVTYSYGGGVAAEGYNGSASPANSGDGGQSGQAERQAHSVVAYGGAGGSGIVVIRFSDTFSNVASTTGSPTYTASGGYRTYKFTGSGSITF